METKLQHLRRGLVAAPVQAVILLAVVNQAGFVPWMRTLRAKCVKHYSGVSVIPLCLFQGCATAQLIECFLMGTGL